MADLRLSVAARRDLAEIHTYGVREFGRPVSDDYIRGFDSAFDLLREHPFVGPAQPDLGEGLRCLMHRRHRIFYHVEGERVLVFRIIHHRRNAASALR